MSGTAGYGDRTWISVDEGEKRTNKNKSNTNPIADQPVKPGKVETINRLKKGDKNDDGSVYILPSR